VEQILGLNDSTKFELTLIDQYTFNIFQIRDSTKNNELVTVISTILAKERIFDKIPIVNEKFIPFMQKIS